ncbi:MAG: cobalamin-dependent protein [Planctomycetes bacterium]|nr:cobalamin-dependent protein [Planctomycetota bacterium]
MRVTLIRYHDLGNINTRLPASLNKRQGALPPLGLAYVAAALREAGHEVAMIDAIAENVTREEVKRRILDFKTDLVGVTAMTPTFRGAQEAARIGKECGCQTVIGGVHMALFARETLSYDYIDFGVIGEGEEPIVALCKALESGESYEGLPGLAYKTKDGEVVVGPSVLVQDLDTLPFPAFDLLPMDRYSSIIGLNPVTTMMGSRGCPYLCGFCYKTPSDRKYRRRSAKNIVDEIVHVKENYGVREVMFYDDLMPPNYIEELCNEILSRGVKIAWEVPQRVNLVNPELLALMRKAGCRMLRYGVEQGDEDMMQIVEKRISKDQVKKVFKWTHDAGIHTFAYFIVGYVGETPATMRATIDLAKELDPRYVMFTKATPLPDTPLFEDAVKAGLIERDYWRKFVLGQRSEPIKPCVDNAKEWVERAYREFYFRPWRMVKQVFYIRSWADFKKSFDAFLGLLFFKMSDDEILQKISTSVDEKEKKAESVAAWENQADGEGPVELAPLVEETHTEHPVGADIEEPDWVT